MLPALVGRTGSVLEVPLPRQDHRGAALVGQVDGLLVADGAAGVDDGGDAGVEQDRGAVGEGEEGVAGGDGGFGVLRAGLGGGDEIGRAAWRERGESSGGG